MDSLEELAELVRAQNARILALEAGQPSNAYERKVDEGHHHMQPVEGMDDAVSKGFGYQLNAGDYLTLTRDAWPNNRRLTIDVQGALVNVDYVVDSQGRGTHTELFSGDGALEDAIATGGDRVIWVCSGHSESIATTHALTNLADGQEITVMSAGINRPSFIVAAGLGAGALIEHGTNNSGGPDGSRLRFQGVSFTRPSGTTAGPWFKGTGGWATPDIDLIDVTFSGASDLWAPIFDFTGTSADVNDILLERIVSDINIVAVVEIASTGALGKFVISNCDFASLDYIQKRGAATDVDVGRDGIIITDNLFRVITTSAWRRTYDTGPGDHWPFVFTGNIILDFQASAPCLDIGTVGTTSPADATIDGNFIRCSSDNAATRAVLVTGGAGTAQNISIVGNSFQGPGGAQAHVAVKFAIAAEDCAVLNSYRDWATNVEDADGNPGPGTGTFDHYHTLIRDDDNDTKVQVEESSDEDIIRFDAEGGEVMQIGAAGQLKIATQGDGGGVLIGLDTHLYRSAENVLSMAAADRLSLDSGGLVVGVDAEAAISIDGTDWTPVGTMGLGEAGGSLYLQGRNNMLFVVDPTDVGARNFYWYHGADLMGGTLLMQLAEDGLLRLPTDGSGGGLRIGGTDPVQLYRDSANELRTPDAFRVDTYMAIGTALDPAFGLTIVRSWADATPTATGLRAYLVGGQTGAGRSVKGITGTAVSTHAAKPNEVMGIDFQVALGNTVGATSWIGMRVVIASATGSGSVDDTIGYEIVASWTASHTLDRFRGFHCPDLTGQATDGASDIFGLQVDAFDASATPNRYPLFYGDVGSGLWWVDGSGRLYFKEATAPSTPAANILALYVKDKAGVSELYYKNDNGDERDLSLAGAAAEPSLFYIPLGSAEDGSPVTP